MWPKDSFSHEQTSIFSQLSNLNIRQPWFNALLAFHPVLFFQVELERYAKLSGLGVSLTDVLVAEQKVPDRFIRVDNGGSQGEKPVQLHFHDGGDSCSKTAGAGDS